MRKLFTIKLIIINILIFAFGIGLALLISKELDKPDTSEVIIGTLAGMLGAPIIGLISFEIRCVFDYLKFIHKPKE